MKNSEKKRKKWPAVLISAVLIVCALVGTAALGSARNMKVVNETLDAGLNTLSGYTTVTPVDPGEYRHLRMYGVMKFNVSQYDVESIGNLSVMTVDMGTMQMVSFILTPYEKNMPLLSMDHLYIFGKRKAYTEFYDLVPDSTAPEYADVLASLERYAEKYGDLADMQISSAWYNDLLTVAMFKEASREDDVRLEDMFCDAIRCYMDAAERMDPLTGDEKAEKLAITQIYCDDLISRGGVSTDVFKKQLGEEKTKDFFDKVLFGTERF